MRIYGVEIRSTQIDMCLGRMKQGPFTHFDIDHYAQRLGIPAIGASEREWISHRFADRLIQRERKAGNLIQPQRGRWCWRELT